MTTLALLLWIAGMQQVPTGPAQPALVLGRVVDAATGRPVAGAVVTPAGSAAVSDRSGSEPVRVLTNATGHFLIRGLSRGDLVLLSTKNGYVDASYGQRRPGGSTQPIRLEPGEWKTDVELRMWKYAAISGTVIDEAGDPVVGTRVEALRKTFIAGRRRFAPAAAGLTDDRGSFRIPNLTPSEYIIVVPSTQISVPSDVVDAFFGGMPIGVTQRTEVSREMGSIGAAIAPAGSSHAINAGGQTLSLPPGTLNPVTTRAGTMVYSTTYYPAAGTAEQAALVAVTSGEERAAIDLQVQPSRGVRVSGTLLGPDGAVPATALHLISAAADLATDPHAVATTMTDWTGAFTFANVPSGSYLIRVLRLPRPPVNVDDTANVSTTNGGRVTIATTPRPPPAGPPPVPADATLVALVPISVSDRDLGDVVVSLAPGPRVNGRVEFEGTIDTPPVASQINMRITLDPADGSRLDDATLALETGRIEPTGRFRTYGVPPGRYVLRVSSLPAGWFVKKAIYDGRDISDVPLDLESKEVSGVVVTFTDRPSSLSGIVRNAAGNDASAVVLVYPVDPEAWSSSGALSRRLRTARAANDGSYSVTGLPAGEYFVVALQEDAIADWQEPALLRALSRTARTVLILDGEHKTENLQTAAGR